MNNFFLRALIMGSRYSGMKYVKAEMTGTAILKYVEYLDTS